MQLTNDRAELPAAAVLELKTKREQAPALQRSGGQDGRVTGSLPEIGGAGTVRQNSGGCPYDSETSIGLEVRLRVSLRFT